jgi:cellulose synthase/poly-beta-1,6-N-acetylglucosamine synthase-like glycosyltransferase
VLATIGIGVVALASLALFGFGVNLLYLTWRATRLRPRPHARLGRGEEPRVCVQIPIYNERYVAERVLDAVCVMDWPSDRLEVQVLDDSDDETVSIVGRRVAHWRDRGIDATHVRRGSRIGFKAGSLAHGMTLTSSPFIAIFDADFVPPPDFLRRTIGVFEDPSIGFAQARWGHLDEGYSWFTRLQALTIDFHFLVEQAVRSASGYFTNFTGTAGVWRRSAIEDAGGWSADTLTEDLDLSYRAQLRGWRAAYLEDLVVPEELPVSIDPYRRQQSRWATGSFQSAFKLLIPVLRSRTRAAVKLQATIHLLAYGVGPLMLIQLACYPVLLTLAGNRLWWPLTDASMLVVVVAASPWIGFIVAQTRLGRPWWRGIPSLFCQIVGAGMSLTALLALFRATRRGGRFVRTPKYRIEQPGQEWRHQAYVRVGDPLALAEAAFGLFALAIIPLAATAHQWLSVLYASMFALGFLTLASLTALDALEVLTLRSLGRSALARVRAAAPTFGLLGLCGVLLLLAAQLPEPFEDGYGHWLIAANLTSTGNLNDPVFGMEDTWLPGYHLLASAILHAFGLWQLGALKALGALLGLVTLACVYALAPNTRQARLAVALVALNPVFLFTSGSAVAEPLLTALLTAAALAAVRGRMKVASLLAALACVTATKAWIWIAAIAGFTIVELLRSRPPAWRRMPGIAWAVPAIGLLVFLQLGFAPASHSFARGSLEMGSAAARGSLPTGALGRLAEVTRTFGLAALPLFAFAALGLWNSVRRPSYQQERPTARFLHAPALVYLAAVIGLMTIGAYTGSHRYLYPALPSLALLAAGALDRYSTTARVATVGATALLAVAFLPVFMSFAADNAGLVAAGRASAGSPGMLITDSPVAAFYSGKPPSQVAGSRVLPPDRQEAIAWMRAHNVTGLVLEDISYYRARAIFPDLVSGQATLPFASLGEQAQYQVAGGKPVYAYRLETVPTQSIYGAVNACIECAPGKGKTAPLARGVVLAVTGSHVVGEGMGFGVPIVRYPDGWVYSRTATTSAETTKDHTVWRRTYQMDEIGGDAARDYSFVSVPSRGAIEVTYTVDATGVSVAARTIWLAPGASQVGILNEQSAAFDDFADATHTLIGSRFPNWVLVDGGWARLRSESLGVEWSAPALPGAELHAGRELIGTDFDWAGLDYLFPASFTRTTFHLNMKEAT